jgi:hypothetical protein
MKKCLVLIISMWIGYTVYSQNSTVGGSFIKAYTDKDFSPNKVYYKGTGNKVTESDFRNLSKDNQKMYFEKEIDEEGNVIRYLYDPDNQNRSDTETSNVNVSENSTFPNFKVTTIDNKKIELKSLAGKLVILRFEFEANSFRFNKQEIVELDKKINALDNKEDVAAIIIFNCSEDEVRTGFDLKDSNFELVANGLNFVSKYNIHRYPTTLLIDPAGKYIEQYSSSDHIILKDHLKK